MSGRFFHDLRAFGESRHNVRTVLRTHHRDLGINRPLIAHHILLWKQVERISDDVIAAVLTSTAVKRGLNLIEPEFHQIFHHIFVKPVLNDD